MTVEVLKKLFSPFSLLFCTQKSTKKELPGDPVAKALHPLLPCPCQGPAQQKAAADICSGVCSTRITESFELGGTLKLI